MKSIKDYILRKETKERLILIMLVSTALMLFMLTFTSSPFDVPEGEYTGKVVKMTRTPESCTKYYTRGNSDEYREVCTEEKFTVVVDRYIYKVDEEIFNSMEVGKETTVTYKEGVVTK